jgi:hypothetical protein
MNLSSALDAIPLPALISRHLQLVTADIHAAPAARSLLACIKKVNHASLASPNPISLGLTQ